MGRLKRVAINGFGRIGRLTLRHLLENPAIEVVAVNDLADVTTVAHLFKYDTSQGLFTGSVEVVDHHLVVNGREISYHSQSDPSQLPWADLQVDVVLECTGRFRERQQAEMHLSAGAKKVVISAPAKSGDVPFIVLGVNDQIITPDMRVISNASCTTNCLAPVVNVLHQKWGMAYGFITTTHGYTADQRLQDAPHADLRRARAAAQNIIPTTTGAAKALGVVIPQLEGKLKASALRVPVVTGSLIELTCVLQMPVTSAQVNAEMQRASESELKGILQYTEAPLVSSDIIGNPHSSIFDGLLTETNEQLLKITSWYDNEAGFAARMADLLNLF